MTRQKQITRIRIDIERICSQTEELFVHADSPSRINSSSNRLLLRTLVALPEPEVTVLFCNWVTDPRHGNQHWQLQDSLGISFGTNRVVLNLQPEGQCQSKCKPRR